MAATALEVVTVERMLLELGFEAAVADANSDEYDADEVARLTAHIGAGVGRVGQMVGYPLLEREVTIKVPRPEEASDKLYLSLPDFIRWTSFSYYETDVYGAAVEGALQDNDGDVPGYPPTFTRSLAPRTDRPLDLEVWPNGLDEGLTRAWPAMAEGSLLELTAATGLNPIPEDMKQAVVLVARAFYDGLERERREDAARALCRPYRDWFLPDA